MKGSRVETIEAARKEYAELYLSRNFKRILEAKRLGVDFARKNLSL